MSWLFKRTFDKAKERFEKGVKEVENIAEKSVDKFDKGADLAKQGLEKAGDFILNSSERDYWNNEISTLRSRLDELRGALERENNTFYEAKLKYHEKYCHYLFVSADTLALGLISPQTLDKVVDEAGIIVDATRSFYESDSEVEEITRYALGFISAGISDIILASQEASKEAQHLREQISALENGLNKIHANMNRYQEGKLRIQQVLEKIIKLYGNDTTLENFIEKQCKFIYKKGQEEVV